MASESSAETPTIASVTGEAGYTKKGIGFIIMNVEGFKAVCEESLFRLDDVRKKCKGWDKAPSKHALDIQHQKAVIEHVISQLTENAQELLAMCDCVVYLSKLADAVKDSMKKTELLADEVQGPRELYEKFLDLQTSIFGEDPEPDCHECKLKFIPYVT